MPLVSRVSTSSIIRIMKHELNLLIVADALARYINQGITLGSVNLPEVQLRSLTLDEPDHARIIYIHRNVPGVLRKVNEILGDHNVDKQISDSRGDVRFNSVFLSRLS